VALHSVGFGGPLRTGARRPRARRTTLLGSTLCLDLAEADGTPHSPWHAEVAADEAVPLGADAVRAAALELDLLPGDGEDHDAALEDAGRTVAAALIAAA
jgi:hypothetical protein